MSGFKWVAAIVIVCVLVVVGARMRSERAQGDGDNGLGTQAVQAFCTDPECGWEGEAEVPLGSVVDQVRCPECDAWDPRGLSDSGQWGASTLRRTEPPAALEGEAEEAPVEAEE
jgi:hypothetical protein